MTKTEDQIIAEAKRLAYAEKIHETGGELAVAVARHALRLATQPEQDPGLVKAMAVWDEAREAWAMNDFNHETAAFKIMDAYPAPSAELIDWAIGALSTPNTFAEQRDAARYILTMAGGKQ